jgi:hypothetical protein
LVGIPRAIFRFLLRVAFHLTGKRQSRSGSEAE